MQSVFVWLDLEMTGLSPTNDHILELAIIVTRSESGMKLLENQGLHVYIQPDPVRKASPEADRHHILMESMNEWCQDHHTKSGLVEQVLRNGISVSEAETHVLKYFEQLGLISADGKKLVNEIYLCGNSVYMDKMFIQQYMPRFYELLHYRVVDVSTLKTLCSHWHPKAFDRRPAKRLTHRALDDILESLEELRFYRDAFLNIRQQP